MKSDARIFLITLSLVFPFVLYAQENSDSIVTGTSEAAESNHTAFYATGYGNSLNYLGSSLSEKQYFVYNTLIYGYKGELFLSASLFHLNKVSPFFPLYNESVSYDHVINSWFDYSLAISGYQADKRWADTLFSDMYNGDVTAGIDWRILYTRVSFGGSLSDVNKAYLQFRNSRYFETAYFCNDRFFISFDPYMNIVLGSYYTGSSTDKTNNASEQGIESSASSKKDKGGETRFGMIDIDIGIPVSFNSLRFTIEAEPGYIFSFNTDAGYSGTDGFSLFISAYIKIF